MIDANDGKFNLCQHLQNWAGDLNLFRQNRLLDESALISFAKDRGIEVYGVVKGDPGNFNRRGWLPSDGQHEDGKPLFHPFRIYTLHRILNTCKLNIAASCSLNQENITGLITRKLEMMASSIEQIGLDIVGWNRIAELAILLDPIYWPIVTGLKSRPLSSDEDEYKAQLEKYRMKALQLVESLDPDEWQKLHDRLRLDAAELDRNGSLYLLLRLSKWDQRKKIKGQVSGALWIRHIAEVIRRAFEEVHKVQWLEEDHAFGFWRPGGRTVAYGSERPLDDTLQSPSRLAFHFGLFTGSVVCWYVEGATEYYAILSVIPEPSKVGIELIDLRGNLASEKDNIALKLGDRLAKDRAHRRFSIISFDVDVPKNVKFIRNQVDQNHIVGFIAAHKPDFEFANFTLDELIEVAAQIDEAHGVSGDPVRHGKWSGVETASEFEEKYMEFSTRKPRSLKGEEWGKALAAYADKHPQMPIDENERPFWREIRAALQSRTAHYDLQREHYGFDPNTFELIDLGK